MTLKKISYLILFLAVFLFSFHTLKGNWTNAGQNLISPVVTKVPSPIIAKISPALPKTIVITKLNVEAPIEAVQEDSAGRMDVPKDVYKAAWYSFGVKPGESGKSVIAGHINTPSFSPSIFYKLHELEIDDIISVIDEAGNSWNFKVREKAEFDSNTFPISLVFGKSDMHLLNLITCSGTWVQGRQEYSKRLVVFSELI